MCGLARGLCDYRVAYLSKPTRPLRRFAARELGTEVEDETRTEVEEVKPLSDGTLDDDAKGPSLWL